jgi:hypothetical protein
MILYPINLPHQSTPSIYPINIIFPQRKMCRMRFSWKNGRDDGGELPPYRPIHEEAVILKYTSASRNIVMITTRSNSETLKVNCQPAVPTSSSAGNNPFHSDDLPDVASAEHEKAGEASSTTMIKI